MTLLLVSRETDPKLCTHWGVVCVGLSTGHQDSDMAICMCPWNSTERVPEPLIKPMGGCTWTSFNSHIFSTIHSMSKILWFSESLERDLSNDVFQLLGPNLSFFGLGPWAIIHGWQILLSLKYNFWWYHLKGLFLSFQKIRKSLKLDPWNPSYGSWKRPRNID